MSQPTLHQTIELATAAVPENLKVVVAELVAKAWENGREEAHREIISRTFARDRYAFGHPANDFEQEVAA